LKKKRKAEKRNSAKKQYPKNPGRLHQSKKKGSGRLVRQQKNKNPTLIHSPLKQKKKTKRPRRRNKALDQEKQDKEQAALVTKALGKNPTPAKAPS